MEYLFLLLFVFYLAPWVLAESIEHRRANTILFLNLGLGWTGLGWLAAVDPAGRGEIGPERDR